MYEKSKIEQGYYFSRLWYDRGMIAFKENSPRQALQYFRHSETAAKGDILDNHQLLDLWIQQSLCYLELGEMDSSMQLLSRVTNYNATSSLRIKAMYLRAEIYEKQGRHELAKKQLQATSSKGGEWALKAKQKLEKDYVHQQHSS
jgi:tetratricopeptide (TPR) repeat protein